MREYFAFVEGRDPIGPFETMWLAVAELGKIAHSRHYSHKQIEDFFLHHSSIERMEPINGRLQRLPLNWQRGMEALDVEAFADKKGSFALSMGNP